VPTKPSVRQYWWPSVNSVKSESVFGEESEWVDAEVELLLLHRIKVTAFVQLY